MTHILKYIVLADYWLNFRVYSKTGQDKGRTRTRRKQRYNIIRHL